MSAQAEFDALDAQFQKYVTELRRIWLSENRPRSRDVYEVMCPTDRVEVHSTIDRWGRYVTPLAETWWKERGYGVTWPEDNSKPVQYHKLETEPA